MGSSADTFRILIATDCHLGYMEKDEIRRNDSFNTFEEICRTAADSQVDFMLLGGDLFHENRPSSTTLVKAIEILRRYCLNDLPVQFQVVSDQTINFPNRFGHVNYEDPHYNVGLPVFTIHGNHDDPAGVENISAIDVLSASNLVNYFGKVDLGSSGVGKIALHPILLRKGLTKIALYGLGNIRDERLNRIFQTPQAVQWIRPADQEGCSANDWFNMFVLHQNRVKANPKNAINEHFLARFLDFVVWGHEHECLVDPQDVAGMGFHLSQPGSSVATSLSEGEAKPKHILILEIQKNKYRPVKIPLTTVRPFKFKEVVLREEPIDSDDPKAILAFLEQVVQGMVEEVANEGTSSMLPLIRVKVDYTECTTINAQKFGHRFVGKVANPQDVLSFSKSNKKKQQAQSESTKGKELLRPEELNQQNIEALVAENDPKMEIIPLNDFGTALHDFVAREERQAFHTLIENSLQETQAKLLEDEDGDINLDTIANKVSQHMEKRKQEVRPSRSSGDLLSAGAGGASTSSTPARPAVPPDDDDDDFLLQGIPATRSKASSSATPTADDTGAKKGRGRGRGRGSRGGRGGLKQTTLDSSLPTRSRRSAASATATVRDSEEEDDPEELDEAESDPEPAPTPASRGRKRAAASTPPKRGRGRGRGSGSSKRGRRSTQTRVSNMDDDEEDEKEDEDEQPTPTSRTQPARRNWGTLKK